MASPGGLSIIKVEDGSNPGAFGNSSKFLDSLDPRIDRTVEKMPLEWIRGGQSTIDLADYWAFPPMNSPEMAHRPCLDEQGSPARDSLRVLLPIITASAISHCNSSLLISDLLQSTPSLLTPHPPSPHTRVTATSFLFLFFSIFFIRFILHKFSRLGPPARRPRLHSKKGCSLAWKTSPSRTLMGQTRSVFSLPSIPTRI